MNAGTFIKFFLPFKKNGVGVSAQDQALAILGASRERIQHGAKGVGIIYSANYGQTRTIETTYKNGGWFTGTDGANQAAVVRNMETLMGNPPYQDLQGKLHIVPITTMNGYADGIPNEHWDINMHLEIVQNDLARLQNYLEDGWDVLGWQNQTTVDNPNQPYAVGGGIATLPDEVSKKIQATLKQFAIDYKQI